MVLTGVWLTAKGTENGVLPCWSTCFGKSILFLVLQWITTLQVNKQVTVSHRGKLNLANHSLPYRSRSRSRSRSSD